VRHPGEQACAGFGAAALTMNIGPLGIMVVAEVRGVPGVSDMNDPAMCIARMSDQPVVPQRQQPADHQPRCGDRGDGLPGKFLLQSHCTSPGQMWHVRRRAVKPMRSRRAEVVRDVVPRSTEVRSGHDLKRKSFADAR
jgi:hypothetical protein